MLIIMFKVSKNTLTNIIHTFLFLAEYTFIGKKIITDRKSFCISIIGQK